MGSERAALEAIDVAILEFESGWWTRSNGRPKRQAIRDDLGISPARFYARLEQLTDSPAAALSHPLVIARLRRRRAERRRDQLVGGEAGHRGW